MSDLSNFEILRKKSSVYELKIKYFFRSEIIPSQLNQLIQLML